MVRVVQKLRTLRAISARSIGVGTNNDSGGVFIPCSALHGPAQYKTLRGSLQPPLHTSTQMRFLSGLIPDLDVALD